MNNIDTFCLYKQIPLYIYGDNFIGRKLLTELILSGYSVVAIIDKKYDKLIEDDTGLKFLNLELLETIDSSSIIIICLSNGLMHEELLKDLMKKGFENIIYLPMCMNRPIFEQNKIRIAFRNIMANRFFSIVDIPKTKCLYQQGIIQIYKNEKEIAFLCDTNILRTATKKKIEENVLPGKNKLVKNLIEYSEIPLCELVPYIELFDFLMNKNSIYPNDYLVSQRETDTERKRLLEDRRKLLNIYETNYNCNYNFFLTSPANAQWNGKGYFNIIDGLHRSVYLMLKKEKNIPIVVSNTDWENYIKFRGDKE